jgi:hypothetical protein
MYNRSGHVGVCGGITDEGTNVVMNAGSKKIIKKSADVLLVMENATQNNKKDGRMKIFYFNQIVYRVKLKCIIICIRHSRSFWDRVGYDPIVILLAVPQ